MMMVDDDDKTTNMENTFDDTFSKDTEKGWFLREMYVIPNIKHNEHYLTHTLITWFSDSEIRDRKIINFSTCVKFSFFIKSLLLVFFFGPNRKTIIFCWIYNVFRGFFSIIMLFFVGKCCCGKWCRTVVNNFFFTLPFTYFILNNTHIHTQRFMVLDILCVCVVLMYFYVFFLLAKETLSL